MNDTVSATKVSLIAVAGQAITYGFAILMARKLGVDGFDHFVLAAAAFIVMVTFVSGGYDKYSLRILPALVAHGRGWAVRRYLRFAVRRTLGIATAIAMLLVGCVWFVGAFSPDLRWALLFSGLALPAGALVHLGLEVLTAMGLPVYAALIFRILVPGTAMIVFCMGIEVAAESSAALGTAAWTVGWVAGAGVMLAMHWRWSPAGSAHASAEHASVQDALVHPASMGSDEALWKSEARPFWIYRLSMAALAQAGIFGVNAFQSSPTAVGAYAAALGTAGLAQVLATATNRVFARRLSLLLEREDFEMIERFRRRRLLWLSAPLTIYLIATLFFARDLLAFFRPEFVEEGVAALRILSCATAFIVLFALSPTYLKFRRLNQLIYVNVGAAAVLHILLLVMLVPRWGPTGAAVSYAVAMVGMYGNMARLARREFTAMRTP